MALCLVSLVFTQVILPGLRGQSLFPLLRASWRRAVRKRVKATDDVIEAKMSLDAAKQSIRAASVMDQEAEEFEKTWHGVERPPVKRP